MHFLACHTLVLAEIRGSSKPTCLLQMLADIRPNEEHAKEHIERNPVTTVAQVVPEMSEHEVGLCCLKISHSACLQ